MKRIVLGFVFALSTQVGVGQSALSVPQYVPQGVVSDWASGHVLYPESKDYSVTAANQSDLRWVQSWYLRHQEAWWPEHRGWHHRRRHRDWSVSLSASPSTAAFEPTFDFSYGINLDTGFGSLNTTDNGGGEYLATSGFLTITATGTGVPNGGTYPLHAGGPAQTLSPSGKFQFDDILYPGVVPPIDNNGPLFIGGGFEFNLWSNFPGPNNYEFDDFNGSAYTNDAVGPTFTLTPAPGGGQTSPAKFVFDVTSAPSCANDYVVIGVPATPASGGQANIVGVNNLYSGGVGALCPSGPTVKFAYASGTGLVPASVAISLNGSQIAYVENLPSGSSYFHVLTLGTTGSNGTSATAAVVPGVSGGNNAVDQRVLLSPDGGVTNQSSTNAAFVAYTHADASDAAYATTYSAQTGSGYLYKITNVFNGSSPTIAWSVAINAVPSAPVYDSVSNKVFFTDSNGRIDYVIDNVSPSVVYSGVLANGATSENPVIVDSTNQMVYASFNTNGAHALVVQAPTSMLSAVSVSVGTGSTVHTGPYEPNFSLAWYTGSGTPVMYVAGTDATGTIPTLYSVGFSGGVMNSIANVTTAALATGTADSSPLTEFYNAAAHKDYLFVGVTDHCKATIGGGTAGCVMSLDITSGFPTVNASSIALPAAGGTTGIIVDNNSGVTQASSIYYGTKTGASLVKATQSALN